MSHVEVVEELADVTLSASGPLVHVCPHRDEVDEGSITITWRCSGKSYELHSLAEYLGEFQNVALSHEELTDRIAHELSVVVGIEDVAVETTWRTAGMEVRCVTTATPAATPC